MSFKKVLKTIMPDGKTKNFLIYLNHLIHARNCKMTYKKGAYVANFYDQVLKGFSVIFPNISYNVICGIPRETPPYFSGQYIKEGSVIIDAGAFPGDFTVLAAKIVGPTGKVLALEPNPENRTYLEKVLRANEVENIVELLPYALSKDNSGVSFAGETLFAKIVGDGPSLRRVPTITIDDLLTRRNFLNQNKNIVVKMDIEGGELDAFDGAKSSLDQGVKFIIAAYHIVNGQRTAEILQEKFKQQGYNVSLINSTHLTLLAEK